MTGEPPAILQGDKHGKLSREFRERAQIKISSVEIVEVHHIRTCAGDVSEPLGIRMLIVLAPPPSGKRVNTPH